MIHRLEMQRARRLGATWWVLLCLSALLAVLPGCGCDGSGNSGSGGSAGSSTTQTAGSGGGTTSVPSDLKAVIIATPPAIPRGDNYATQVRLDGSASTSSSGKLSYQWNIGQGKLVSGELFGAQIYAAFDGLDNAPVTLTVTDGDVSNSTTTVIRVQSPPVVIVSDEASTDAGAALTLDASQSFDRDGDPLAFQWTIIDGPSGAQVSGMPGGKATFTSSTPGDYTLEIALTAGGQTAFGQTIVHVFPAAADQEPVGVSVVVNPPVAAKGAQVAFQISLSDTPKGPYTVTLRAGDQVIPLNNLSGSATFASPGDYPVIADVIAVGRGGRGRASLQVYDPAQPDNGPPVVSLSSPDDAARLTATVQANGTASDSDLAAYYLEARQSTASPSEPWQRLYRGTTSVNGGVLGPIEVTLLRQTDYVLRLRAVDRRGHVASVERKMSIDFTVPHGDLRFVLTDFKSAFSGPPLVIRRGYDSFDRTIGDFGYGWTLSSSGNGSVTRANTIGEGWDPTGTDCIFNYNLSELENHLITVAIGDQRSFYAPTPQINSCITGAVVVTNAFTKLGGGKGSMTIEHQDEDLLIPFGDNNMYRFDALFDPTQIYDPNDYTVTNADDSVAKFSNGGQGGNPKLVQMRDVGGNGFDVSDDQNTITHTSGGKIELSRDAKGRVIALSRPDGKERHYTYNDAQELIAASDFDGRTLRYFYGPDHVLSRIVGPRGNVVFDARYDDVGRLLTVHNGAADASATTTYDMVNHKDTTVLPNGVTDVTAYDASGQTTLRTMNGHQIEKYETDPQAKKNSFTDAAGRKTSVTYDDTHGAVVINPEGMGDVTLQYDANGDLNGMNTPKGTIAYARDASGHMTHMQAGAQDLKLQRDASGKVSHLDQNGYTLDFTHNAAGYTTSVTAEGTKFNFDVNGVGDVTGIHYSQAGEQVDITMTVDSDGVPTSTTALVDGQMVTQQAASLDAEGLIGTDSSGRKLVRDGRGRAQHLLGANTTVTTQEYDPAGQLKAITMPEGGRTEMTHDPVTGARVTTLPNGDKLVTHVDAAGRISSREAPGGQIVTYDYDAEGRPTDTTLPDGRKATRTYDAQGRVASQSYIDGSIETYTYGADGGVASVKQGSRPPFSYAYDPNSGALTRTISPTGVTQYRAYNARVLLESVSYEGGPAATLYTYAGKRLASITDPAGHKRSFGRAKLGTVETETRPGGATQTTTRLPDGGLKVVDFDGRQVLASLDLNGHVTGLTADDGTHTETQYDRDARLASYTDSNGTTSFARDTLGRVLTMTLADGRALKIAYDKVYGAARVETPGGTDVLSYDATGHLTRVDLDVESGIDIGYDDAGRQTTFTLGSLVISADHDSAGLVAGVTTAYGGADLLSDTFTYDDDGRPVAIASSAGEARSFTYDAAERLKSDTGLAYGYDAASNLTKIGDRTLTYNSDDHILSDGAGTFTTDKSGHLLTDTAAEMTFSWDGLGRLTSVTKGAQTVTYQYDTLGLLVARDDGADARRFLWSAHEDLPSLLEEYDPKTGDVLARNTHLGRLIVRTLPDKRLVFVRDALQNARLVVDEKGQVVDTREITAYGALESGSVTLDAPFGFAGEWTDPVTGLVYMRARWYSPRLGRFLSEDPAPPRLDMPITLNRFQYGNGMPTVFVDPAGKQDIVGLLSTMAGYGNLQSMSTLTSVNYYLSLTSQFIGLGMAMFSMDRSGLFKFIQEEKKSWIPTSIVFGASMSVWGGGVGLIGGIEGLYHFHTQNFNGHITPYVYWGGPGAGAAATAAAKDSTIHGKPVDPSVLVIPPQGGGIVGQQAFIGFGINTYLGLAWDVVHPGAYAGPFSALSAHPALLFPIVTLGAALQMDGLGQLAAFGLAGAGAGLAVNALSGLGPAMGALITAGFNAIAAGNANPGQIWTHRPPPTTVAFNNASTNFNNLLRDWASAHTAQFSWSSFASDTKLCSWDAATQKWINCVPAQTWSITYDTSSLSGLGVNTTNKVTQAPLLFSYLFTMYWCFDAINGGPSCNDEVDITDDQSR